MYKYNKRNFFEKRIIIFTKNVKERIAILCAASELPVLPFELPAVSPAISLFLSFSWRSSDTKRWQLGYSCDATRVFVSDDDKTSYQS